MSTNGKRASIALGLLLAVCLGARAYDPPKGGLFLPAIFSPWALSHTPTVTGDGEPWSALFNPAAPAGNRFSRLEFSYTGITDFGASAQGLGSAVNLAFSIPAPYGVWSASGQFLSMPASMTDMPLGTLGSFRLGFSKDIFPDLYFGTGLQFSIGSNSGSESWGVGADIGILGKMGDAGIFKDASWGLSLLNAGKGYETAGVPVGMLGTPATAYPSAFTLGFGMRGYLVRTYSWKVDLGFDLWTQAFRDASLGVSLGIGFRDFVSLRAGWSAGYVDMKNATARSLLPSLSISGAIPLDGAQAGADVKGKIREVRPAVAAAGLYGPLYGISGGIGLGFGARDRSAPEVEAKLPVPYRGVVYISPDGKGANNSISIPVSVSDEKCVTGWEFRIEDKSSGRVVKDLKISNDQPLSTDGKGSFWRGLGYSRHSIEIPSSVEWDGRDEKGIPVEDGPYIASLLVWDDSGNINLDYQSFLTIVVDSRKPTGLARTLEPFPILSPDGDGRKDSLAFRNTGSVEDIWRIEIADEKGKILRTVQYRERSAPKDFEWDGTADDGRRVPDGVYSLSLTSADKAGNTSTSVVKNIVVDTFRPAVSVSTDRGVMSPNGDGVKDKLEVSVSAESFGGMQEWKVYVLDPDMRQIWSVSGTGETQPEPSYVFGGTGADGKPLPDGQYEAGIEMTFLNGYQPRVLSNPFTIDTTPPSATIGMPDPNRVFSPDGDGSRDTFVIEFASSEEDSWSVTIRDREGKAWVSKKFSPALPAVFEWNGRDDQGRVVPDGEYEVRISCVDAAGNSFAATSAAMKVDTRRPAAAVSVDREAFSPNGDGIADAIQAVVKVSSLEGLSSWRFAVESAVDPGFAWRASGADEASFADRYVFYGKDGQGRDFPEGALRAVLALSYVNGYSTEVSSDSFILDRTYPSATAKADRLVFNPLGRDDQARVRVEQDSSAESLWTARVLDPDGKTVREWKTKGSLQSVEWDGRNDSGSLVPDGSYAYAAFSEDAAGNAFRTQDIPFIVDTMKKTANLRPDMPAFSPNGDGTRDLLTIAAEATVPEKSSSWNMWIAPLEGSGDPAGGIRKWNGAGKIPAGFVWDGLGDAGQPAPDGRYMAFMRVEYPNGDVAEAKAGPVLMDRVAPKGSVKASLELFSPNGDGKKDTVTFAQETVPGDDWEGILRTAGGEVARRWAWKDRAVDFEWDGKDQNGIPVPDGVYEYELSSRDEAGNAYRSGPVKVEVETAKKAVRLEMEYRAFSPNGDGVRDEVGFTVSAQAPERVRDYILRIVAQEGPNALSAVRSWKGEGAVPGKFVWKGETDGGGEAAEGKYAANLTVNYRNGDVEESPTPVLVLDRTAPKIEVSASLSMISPNGDGRSDYVEIKQKSVPGDDWAGRITDGQGKAVRNYSWKGEAKDFVWEGKDDAGNLVRDGEYAYVAESADSAGNRTETIPLKIRVETEKKAVRLDVGAKAFSPNGDGVKDALAIGVEAQYPERIRAYELSIAPAEGGGKAPVKSWKGAADIMKGYSWDGLGDTGQPAPDGRYMVSLNVHYMNDDVHTLEAGPVLMDRVAPAATARSSATIFSPNGDGRSDTIEITQESATDDMWQGTMKSADGRTVRAWTWKGRAESFVWDGKDSAGSVVPDGAYGYILKAEDEAGNSFASPELKITVDASKKTVKLDIDPLAFSPNGDGVKDSLYLNVRATKPADLDEFELSIWALDSQGRRASVPVRSWKGPAAFGDQFLWDGMTDIGIAAPDGRYQAALRAHYANDDLFELASPVITLDTTPPKIAVSADYLVFSPNGDGNRDTLPIRQTSVPGDDWTGRIRNAAGAVVRSWAWKSEAKPFSWDGKDSGGAPAKDGAYTYEVSSADAAGNACSFALEGIRLDAAKPRVFVTASDTGISPNDDGVRDEVSFAIVVEKREGIASWRFSLLDANGKEQSFFGGDDTEVPARLVWDGRDLLGQVMQGSHTGKLVVRYEKGDIVQASSEPVYVNINPPSVDIKLSPDYFSPDGDGVDDRLTISLNVASQADIAEWKFEIFEEAIVESNTPDALASRRIFMEWSGKGKPARTIAWDGLSPRGELVESATDYPFTFTATDALGNRTVVNGIIAVDVLVIRDGDRLKIKVPSIVFRANHADFVGLAQDIVARNRKVVARIAQILNKFPDYRIRIEGHANNVGKMLGYSQARVQSEETKELVPLSTGRAELVRGMLVQNGVDSRRLTVQGLGSSEPVVSFTDVENRWKNRRVEFVLIKNQ